jgi:TIR domain
MDLLTPLRVFYSYSHEDEELRDRLQAHLAMLFHEGLIDPWHDTRIGPGDDFPREIDEHLDAADIILLLVSADFMASKYCYDIEMKRAMERHKTGESRVIPVILRPCDWHNAPFGKLKALPTDGKAVATWRLQDSAWVDVTKGIREVVEFAISRSGVEQVDGSGKVATSHVHAEEDVGTVSPSRSGSQGATSGWERTIARDLLWQHRINSAVAGQPVEPPLTLSEKAIADGLRTSNRINRAVAGQSVDPPLTLSERVTADGLRMSNRINRAAAGHSVDPPLTMSEEIVVDGIAQMNRINRAIVEGKHRKPRQ